MGKYVTWKEPKLYKGKDKWWVEYQFRIPEELRYRYNNAKWKGFKVYEDINRIKTDEYAHLLITAVRSALEKGFNPFEYAEEAVVQFQQQTPTAQQKVWTCTQAFNYFIQEWEQRGLEDATLTKLKRAIEALTAYLTKRNMHHEPVTIITEDHVTAALREASTANGWSNRTFNNNKTALSTLFKFLEKKRIIADIPTAGIEKKKTKSKKHRYYDPEQFDRVRKVMKEDDPLVYFATKLIYYLCIRAEKELKHFRVGNIFLDRKQVLIQAEEAKTDADRFIPIPDELMEELTYIRKHYPTDFYVIGKGNRIKFVHENTPSPKPFPNNMISSRFAKIRKKAGITSDHTPYSFKHTRVIHLKQDGAQDKDIMQVTGHTSYQAYAEYLRDLGVDGNPEAINKITRKF
ncbi:MAG TPA: site-specific integrase [Puia sp.]|uniref:tyrosine-type recombinase/integrase n=1 Tax=Puia sp. TaxID=2045100 RepID=UPI002CA0AE29|nr:site-specific integrase [Puia sp.]HVU93752.1 site-specific integrase [Puia sp.]